MDHSDRYLTSLTDKLKSLERVKGTRRIAGNTDCQLIQQTGVSDCQLVKDISRKSPNKPERPSSKLVYYKGNHLANQSPANPFFFLRKSDSSNNTKIPKNPHQIVVVIAIKKIYQIVNKILYVKQFSFKYFQSCFIPSISHSKSDQKMKSIAFLCLYFLFLFQCKLQNI